MSVNQENVSLQMMTFAILFLSKLLEGCPRANDLHEAQLVSPQLDGISCHAQMLTLTGFLTKKKFHTLTLSKRCIRLSSNAWTRKEMKVQQNKRVAQVREDLMQT